MNHHFQKYYQSEYQNAWMRILAGSALGIGMGVLYYYFPYELISGIWWSIFLISIYQIGRGIKKLRRAQIRTKTIQLHWEQQAQQLISSEITYLQARLPKYKFHRNIEILLIIIGFVLILLGGFFNFGWFMLGSGLGLFLQGGVSLYLEIIAEWYAGKFLSKLSRIENS